MAETSRAVISCKHRFRTQHRALLQIIFLIGLTWNMGPWLIKRH